MELLTNAEAVKRSSTPGLFWLLADGCELRLEILAELRERGYSIEDVITPAEAERIRQDKAEDYGLDV